MSDYKTAVLEALLKKYENSRHYSEGHSAQRVMLKRTEKNSIFPEADSLEYDDFLEDMNALGEMGFIGIEWNKAHRGTVIERIVLDLGHLTEIYSFCGIKGKREVTQSICAMIESALTEVTTPWISEYYRQTLEQLKATGKPKREWANSAENIQAFIAALNGIDKLKEPVSMRTFSIRIYSDSKFFERIVKSVIVPIIKSNEPQLSSAVEMDEIDDREVLAQVGIIMMPEIFELCGNVILELDGTRVGLSPFRNGACIPAGSVPAITGAELKDTDRILFIENKTNYTEYCLNLRKSSELVIYHGGFYSPDRGRFFRTLARAFGDIPQYYWGDIDLGGFNMYLRLKRNILPMLRPWRMDTESFMRYCGVGLKRGDEYLKRLSRLLKEDEYSEFHDVIRLICEFGVTIEQECFLEDERL